LIRIEDPFVTKTEWNYKQLKRFLESLLALPSKCPSKILLRTRLEEDPAQKLMIQDLEKWLKPKGVAFGFELIPPFGPGKKDFHDRKIILVPDEAAPKKRIVVLMTGGIDRYLDAKFECTIIVQF
jgi:hypothetical protein